MVLYSYRIFFSGWALKENEKTKTRKPVKRMTKEVKHLLEIMFHTGMANPRQKMNAQQMHEELLQYYYNEHNKVNYVKKMYPKY